MSAERQWSTGDPLFPNYMALLLSICYGFTVSKAMTAMGILPYEQKEDKDARDETDID